ARLCKAQGARSVRAAVSHSILNDLAYERLREGLIDELITTNSVPVQPNGLPIVVLSIAELLGEAIVRISRNESVTSLFEINGYRF
ncbi:MAG TPA: ribose-phosphate diphosphokinase, partial [Opitutales bacterium]|nr:ribose-phosphate diphosphokinase [Opitutales bacterium]